MTPAEVPVVVEGAGGVDAARSGGGAGFGGTEAGSDGGRGVPAEGGVGGAGAGAADGVAPGGGLVTVEAPALEWSPAEWHASGGVSVTGWRGWSLVATRADGDAEVLSLAGLHLRSPEGWSLDAAGAVAHLPSGMVALWAPAGRLGPWDLRAEAAQRRVDGTWALESVVVSPCAGWQARGGAELGSPVGGGGGGEPAAPADGATGSGGGPGGGRGDGHGEGGPGAVPTEAAPLVGGAEPTPPAGEAGCSARPPLSFRAHTAEVDEAGTVTLRGGSAAVYGVPVLPVPWWRLSTRPTRLHLLLPELGLGSPGWSAGWQAELVTPTSRTRAGLAWREDRGVRLVGELDARGGGGGGLAGRGLAGMGADGASAEAGGGGADGASAEAGGGGGASAEAGGGGGASAEAGGGAVSTNGAVSTTGPGGSARPVRAAASPDPPLENTAMWALGHDLLSDTTRGALRADGGAQLGGVGAAWQLDVVSDAAWDEDMGASWVDRGVDWHESRVALAAGPRDQGGGFDALATSGELGAGVAGLRVGAGWAPGRDGLVLRSGDWLGAVGGRVELGGLPAGDDPLAVAAAGAGLWGWVAGAGDTWDLSAGAEARAWTGSGTDAADARLLVDGGLPAWTAGPGGGGVLRWRLGGRALGEVHALLTTGSTAWSGGPGLQVASARGRAGAELAWWWGDALPGLLGAPAFADGPGLRTLAGGDALGSGGAVAALWGDGPGPVLLGLPATAGRPLGRAWVDAGALHGRLELGGGGLGAGLDAELGRAGLGLDLVGTAGADPLLLSRVAADWRLGRVRLAGRADADLGALAFTGGALGLGWDDGCLAAGLRAELSPDRALPDVALEVGVRR